VSPKIAFRRCPSGAALVRVDAGVLHQAKAGPPMSACSSASDYADGSGPIQPDIQVASAGDLDRRDSFGQLRVQLGG